MSDTLRFDFRRPLDLAKKVFLSDPDSFLRKVNGVIHVGANSGQECEQYERYNLEVIWVEPIPAVFDELERKIEKFSRQQAFRYLLTDRDGEEYDFNLANNGGASSSIFDLSLHKDIWPDIHYVETIKLVGTTLQTMIGDEGIDLEAYQALIMDTQGSELMVLKGAERILHHFKFIKAEAPDFEAYAGCCLISELAEYLNGFGFREIRRNRFARRKGGGSYFDVVFQKQ